MGIDYDTVASAYDRRYALHGYRGIWNTVVAALPRRRAHVLELGCGTGRWLSELRSVGCEVAGIDASARMLELAADTVRGDLRHGKAEALPWAPETFDLVCCINALHHFTAPDVAMAEAARVLRSGGILLSIGLDPHEGADRWWVYDFFPETRALDRGRFPSAAQRIAWFDAAGLLHPSIHVAERLTSSSSLAEATRDGVLEQTYTSQLTALTDAQYAAGLARIQGHARRDDAFRLVSDLTLYATTARKAADDG